MQSAFIHGFFDELEKTAASVSSTFAPGKKIPKGAVRRTLMRIVSPTIAGRASSAQSLRLLRKLEKRFPEMRGTAELGRFVMTQPGQRGVSTARFALNRLLGGGAAVGAAAIGHRLLKKKKKKES